MLNRVFKVCLNLSLWLGVLFPLILGGWWIERGNQQYGIYSPSVGLGVFLILGLLFGLLNRNWLQDVQSLSSIQFIKALIEKWSFFMETTPFKALFLASLFWGVIYSLVSLSSHWVFKTNSFDVGIFSNALWNLAFRGEYVSSLKDGMNLFADHQSPVLWLWAPLYRLFPFPELLLVSQGFVLALGGPATFFLGKQVLGERSSVSKFIPLIYWLNPAIMAANRFEFHPEMIMLPAALWAIVGFQSVQMKFCALAWFPFLLFWAGKESSGPVMVGLGLSFLLGAGPRSGHRFQKILGLILIPLGFISFYLCTQWVPRQFLGAYAYTGIYQHLGNSLGDIFLSPFLKPEVFWPSTFNWARFRFFWFMLFPLGLIPLLSWRHIPSFFIPFLMLFMMGDTSRLGVDFHYGIESSVGLFWALPTGIAVLLRAFSTQIQRDRTAAWVVIALFICTVLGMRQNPIYRMRMARNTPHKLWIKKVALKAIHPNLSLSAPSNLTPHLVNRVWIHHPPKIRDSKGQLVSCVIYDSALNSWPMKDEDWLNFPMLLESEGYKQIYECRTFQLYQNTQSLEDCLISQPSCDVE